MTMTSVESTVRRVFNFNVNKYPLTGPDGATPWYGLFRSDNGEPVGKGSVTNRYVPHQTDDVVALVDAALNAFGDCDIDCHFRDGHYVTIAPTKDYRRKIYGDKDSIVPRVIINARYDSKSFEGIMGYYRDMCRNMSMLKFVNGTSVSIRHTSSLQSKMDELITTFEVLKNSWGTLANVIEELQNKEVHMVEFLDAIYGQPDPDSKRGVTVHKNRTEAIIRRLQNERQISGRKDELMIATGWEALNAVQGYVQHDATRHNAGQFDRMLLASRDKSVLKAQLYLAG